MTPVRQIPLELPTQPRYGRDDFLVSPSNEAAFDQVETWPDWPGRMLLLIGPAGAGKSHLGAIWAERAEAATIRAADLAQADIPALARQGAALVEDADEIGQGERALFHLINALREGGGSLAMTARSAPDRWGLAIPDLLSRLRLAPIVEIAAPDDGLVRAVLVKLFFDRQLAVDTSVIEFIALRIERSLDAARRVVEMIDREALARRRPVTRPIVADVLSRLDAGEGTI